MTGTCSPLSYFIYSVCTRWATYQLSVIPTSTPYSNFTASRKSVRFLFPVTSNHRSSALTFHLRFLDVGGGSLGDNENGFRVLRNNGVQSPPASSEIFIISTRLKGRFLSRTAEFVSAIDHAHFCTRRWFFTSRGGWITDVAISFLQKE